MPESVLEESIQSRVTNQCVEPIVLSAMKNLIARLRMLMMRHALKENNSFRRKITPPMIGWRNCRLIRFSICIENLKNFIGYLRKLFWEGLKVWGIELVILKTFIIILSILPQSLFICTPTTICNFLLKIHTIVTNFKRENLQVL